MRTVAKIGLIRWPVKISCGLLHFISKRCRVPASTRGTCAGLSVSRTLWQLFTRSGKWRAFSPLHTPVFCGRAAPYGGGHKMEDRMSCLWRPFYRFEFRSSPLGPTEHDKTCPRQCGTQGRTPTGTARGYRLSLTPRRSSKIKLLAYIEIKADEGKRSFPSSAFIYSGVYHGDAVQINERSKDFFLRPAHPVFLCMLRFGRIGLSPPRFPQRSCTGHSSRSGRFSAFRFPAC